MKICSKCKLEKHESLFHKRNDRSNGLQSACIECKKAERAENIERDTVTRKAYYLKNKDKILERSAEWLASNKERKAATNKMWAQLNEEKIKKYREENAEKFRAWYAVWYVEKKPIRKQQNAEWRAKNKERIYAANHNRRALLRGIDSKHSAEDIGILFIQQKGKCAHKWCMKSLKREYHIDHIMALSKGGSNDKTNLQLLCPFCNISKKDKDPIDYAQAHGMLL